MDTRDLSEQTYSRLRDMIIRGRLKPEKRLLEEELAEFCGVSRTPVRDALTRLRNEGYVRATGGARTGLEVSPLRRADVDELWTILGSLETDAARRAAQLPEAERDRLVARLREVNRELDETARLDAPTADDLMTLQSAFHRELVGSTAGPWLVRIYELVRPHAERYEWLYGSLREADLSLSTSEHERIIRLIERGEADAAAEAIRAHWEQARRRTGGLIERYWG